MPPTTAVPPSFAAPLIPPVCVVRTRLLEAINDVRLLKQLLKVSKSAEQTVGADVTTTKDRTHEAGR
jgi:hypothetical protein